VRVIFVVDAFAVVLAGAALAWLGRALLK